MDIDKPEQEILEELKEAFAAQYGDTQGGRCFFAPGRVNLIGEHTDYNGGHVFPCALTIGTYAMARRRGDREIRFHSLNGSEERYITCSLDDLEPEGKSGWTMYPLGVVWTFQGQGMILPEGFEMEICGNIPAGSGLSSSASLEVLTGFVLKSLYGFGVDGVTLAKIGQYSENNYNGMQCGIMDQFASAMGLKDHAIFLNTADLSYTYAPVLLEGKKLVVTNTNKKHRLTDSAYNDRRSSCEQALKELQAAAPIENLCDLTPEQFTVLESYIRDEDRRRKAKHAIYENYRTLQAVEALQNGDLATFGQLMNESHISLRDDYEVSCEELDVLAEEAWKIPGVIGARMTGGGFGGCTVAIVDDDAVETYRKQVGEVYLKRIGYEASFYVVSIGGGPRELK